RRAHGGQQPGAGCSGPRRRGESSSPPPSVCPVDAGSPFDPCRVSRGLPWICSPSCSVTSWSSSITCFDRIVIRGYLTALSRPELVVHFFREIVGVALFDEHQ